MKIHQVPPASLFTYVYGLYEHRPGIVGRTPAEGANCRCTARGICAGTEAGPSQIVVLQNPGINDLPRLQYKELSALMYQQIDRIQHVKITLT